VTEAETENPPLDLVVAANFTAGPVEASLRFWLEGLQLPVSVSHAPYDQAFQQLLDPESVLRRNRHGIGLVLVRLQGWLATDGAPGQDMPSDPDRIARELVAAVTEALRGASSQLVVCFCPSTGLDAETRATLARAERVAADALRDEAGVRVLTSEALLERYPCDQVADPQGEHLRAGVSGAQGSRARLRRHALGRPVRRTGAAGRGADRRTPGAAAFCRGATS
jgi:hypothetical protein